MDVMTLPRPVGFVLGGGGSLGAIQVGMLQALAERGITADLAVGTSVGSINGAVVARDPKGAANRLSHSWARMTREQVFPGGLLAQVRTLRQSKTHLFPNTGLAAMIADFVAPGHHLRRPRPPVRGDHHGRRHCHTPHDPTPARCCPRCWPAPPSPASTRPSSTTAGASMTEVWSPTSLFAKR